MSMIDVGLKIEIAEAAGTTTPVASWRQLKDCSAMPALIQPSTKIATDYIGDEFTGEMLGKRAITGLDFTFAYDGGASGTQYRFLSDADDNNEVHWMRITYPDGTKFELLVECEVTLVAPTPSGELDYTLSVTPHRNSIGELILVIFPDQNDPLATQYSVSNTLSHCTSSNAATSISAGSSYRATITASNSYTLTGATVTITMGGANITSTAYSNGVITIANVTGDIAISITAASV